MNYRIFPPDGLPEASVTMPLSKSVSNRALIISALTENAAPLAELADCTDTAALQRALEADATGGATIDVGDAGTAMRFLTAYFAARPGCEVTLQGSERMHERPIGQLVDALRGFGAKIDYLGREGFPPLAIKGARLTGGEMTIDATVSSQFVSALLMVAPVMTNGLRLTLVGEPASLPYIDLTLSMMAAAGAEAEREHDIVTVAARPYAPVTLRAEGDWSAATFWFEIEALTSGFMTLESLQADSRQPDRRALELFGELGAVGEPSEETENAVELCGSPDVAPRFSADLSATPDMAPALAVTCAMIGVPFRLTGLQSLRIKETDRLEALTTELRKIGALTETEGDHTLSWDGRCHPILERPEFDTYGDHRMAMALAPVGAYIPGVVVRDIEVVGKSYPRFWDDMRAAGFTVVDADSEWTEPSDGEEGDE